MKLSKKQQEVVDLLKQGWELGVSSYVRGPEHCWIQKGGVGKGGESKKVNMKTFQSLCDKHIIIKIGIDVFPVQKYRLKGK